MNRNQAALYLRVSREDEEHTGQSQSIHNQQAFLTQYAQNHDFTVKKVFCDDGYSGLHYDRPGFMQLCRAVEQKEIDVILVKDLSRLGRDYIQTGYYLERYFPQWQVRLIAVNDQIDTGNLSDANLELTPFRSVINDMYAKDISKKVRTALLAKKKEGKFIGAFAPFGYQKDVGDKNHLVADPVTAAVVVEIYRRFLKGETPGQIAEDFTRRKLPPPSTYHYKKQSQGGWSSTMVRRILTNPTYCGCITQNRTKRTSYKVGRRIQLPKEQWITVEGSHTALIEREEFDMVQRLLFLADKPKTKRQHLLAGLLFCGECGDAMTFVSEGERCYLVCSGWKRHGKEKCSSHCIREDIVETMVCQELTRLCQESMPKVYTEALQAKKEEENKQRTALLHALNRNIEAQAQLYKDQCREGQQREQIDRIREVLSREYGTIKSKLENLDWQAEQNTSCTPWTEAVQGKPIFSPQAIRLLAEKIILYEDKAIHLHLTFPSP